MKKQMIIATGLALLSTSAYATRARMQALGQEEDRGSFYVKDSRSKFRNAAYVNTFKNYVVTEWGDDDSARTNSNADPEAEGGFFREMGSFAYGLYMGSGINTTQDLATTADMVGTTFAHTTAFAAGDSANVETRGNELSAFFGGDMGVQWGARINHSTNKNKAATAGAPETKHDAWGLGLGVIFGDIEGYANLAISDEHEGGDVAGDKIEGDFGWNIGANFRWNSWTFFADYDAWGAEYTNATTTGLQKEERTVDQWRIGAGHIHEVTSTARVFSDVQFISGKDEAKLGTTANTTQDNSEISYNRTPVTIGFETDATSWLTLRGSISQVVIINDAEFKRTGAANTTAEQKEDNTTTVNAGATLTFGKLMIDGMIGNNGTNGTAGGGDQGALDLDRLMTRVAVHYWF